MAYIQKAYSALGVQCVRAPVGAAPPLQRINNDERRVPGNNRKRQASLVQRVRSSNSLLGIWANRTADPFIERNRYLQVVLSHWAAK